MLQRLENRMEKMQEAFNTVNTITKDTEEIKNKQTGVNNTITEIKSTLKGTNDRITEAEECISELEDRILEITVEQLNKGKGIKRIEESFRQYLGQYSMHQHLSYRGPSGRKKRKTLRKFLKKTIVENFPKMGKEIVNQVQKVQRIPYKLNPKTNTLRHILIKLKKIKHKGRILKAAKEKQQVTYKGRPIQFAVDLSTETLRPEGNGRIYLKY